ncbi:MAG: carboxypeptidase regulatory-like domain-containing protein, partial [Alphaproteobacteria bacterium]|nr:carboxypeptidase regulatory-like domain-containing protein [Alphaproteobacteria bacterium]
RRATSNEKGYSLIKGLPDTTATDIQVGISTLPDPFMIPATEGQSIFPRGGDIVNMEFPIHLAGELDGTVSIQKKNGNSSLARLLRMQLIPTSGDLSKVKTVRTAGDGFYVFSQIPPGEYLLTPSYEDLKRIGAGQPAPEHISIGYDGAVIYGKNIILSENIPPTPLKMKDGGSQSFVLNIGQQGTSKLSSLLKKMMTRHSDSPLLENLRRVMIKDKNNKDVERYVAPSGTLKESFELCQKLIQDDLPCELEQAMLH